jgi:hypothetical protein
MASRDHNYTRRAVLGAAFTAPALCGVGADVDPARVAAWEEAVAALRRAEVEMDGFCRLCRAGLASGDQSELDAAFDDHLGAFYSALRRLLRTPAPDLAALAAKIILTVDHEVGTLTGGDRCFAALKADVRRLAVTRR